MGMVRVVRTSGNRAIAEGHVKRFVVSLGIGAGLMLMTACSSDRPATVSAAAAAPAVAAQPAARPERGGGYQASGPLVVENQVDVAAQREGVVAKILVDVGAFVRKGQPLAQLDDRQLAAQHDAAVAKAAAVEEDAKNWETEIKLVETDLARDEQLYQYQLITLQQLEHSRYKLIGAKQQREREVQSTNEARATAKALQLELEKTRIAAPFDGVVARRYVRQGQQVALNDRLFWVTATAPLNVRFTLPQELMSNVKPGEMIMLSTPDIAGPEHKAKVTLISPVVDPSSGTIEVQAQVVGDPGELRPGMNVNIRIAKP
jgi:RND family efflux transporter MFP subunit